MKARILVIVLLVAAVTVPLKAQHRLPLPAAGSFLLSPAPPPACPTSINSGGAVSSSWGFYNWQVDLRSATATLASEMDFTTNPGSLVQIPIPATGSLPCNITIHEIHGTVVLEAQQGSSCKTNSMVTQVLDQNGNAIAAASLLQFGPSNANVPIKGTFSTPLSVSSFLLTFNLSPGCMSVLSWELIIS